MVNWLRLRNRFFAQVYSRFPVLAEKWGRGLERNELEIPWTPVKKELSNSKVGLVTTGGVHLKDQVKFSMSDPDGDPTFRRIPLGTEPPSLTITHDYYAHRDADRDFNLVMPMWRLQELRSRKVIKELHDVSYSLMGHIDGKHVERLVNETAQTIAREFKEAMVDFVLLVPA